MPETTPLFTEIETRADEAARHLVESLTRKRLTLALAESCTAGLIADLLARVSGASAVLWGSFVCYTPDAKQRMLGLDGSFLEQHGLVSRETARAMAQGALERAGVSLAAAVTGIAGPSGDGSATPVGTAWTAVAWQGNCREKELHFQGTRAAIRMQAAAAVVEELLEIINLPLDKKNIMG
ncbi:MAG: CinA family protein [Treponema sp.]|jgi:PncC family amidohydrolase|nr:CinA family protein [Treponema sp.]